jgi:hypothetical protein
LYAADPEKSLWASGQPTRTKNVPQ